MDTRDLNPFAVGERQLVTRLDPAECERRVREAVDRRAWRAGSGAGAGQDRSAPLLRGRVGSGGFWVCRARLFPNPFATVAYGTLAPTSGGSRIGLRIGLHRWTVGLLVAFTLAAGIPFLLITFVQLALAGTLLLLRIAGPSGGPGSELSPLALALGLLGVLLVAALPVGAGLAYYIIGRRIAREDAALLAAALAALLEASAAPAPGWD